MDLVGTNAFLGHKDAATAWLDSAYTRCFLSWWFLEQDPLPEKIRNTPAYHRIREEIIERQWQQHEVFRKAIEEIEYIPPEIKITVPSQTSL